MDPREARRYAHLTETHWWVQMCSAHDQRDAGFGLHPAPWDPVAVRKTLVRSVRAAARRVSGRRS